MLVTMHPKGTPMPTPSVEVQVSETRVDLSNDLTWRQMIGVGVRRVVLARGELDKLEVLLVFKNLSPKYAARSEEGGSTPRCERSSESKGSVGRLQRRRRRTRQRRATRQRKKRQERERREWEDREVA